MSDPAADARYLAWLTEAEVDPSAPPAVRETVREALTQPKLQDSSQSLGQRALSDASPLAALLERLRMQPWPPGTVASRASRPPRRPTGSA